MSRQRQAESVLAIECVDSIRQLLSAPDFAPNCTSDRDLCKLFSDGEILCSILAEVNDGHASSESTSFYSLNSQILAKRNVRHFLRQCAKTLGKAEADLFEPDDLLAMRSPERVVQTVHNLLQRSSAVAEDSTDSAAAPVVPGDGELDSVVREICDKESLFTSKLMKLLFFRKELLGLLSEWPDDLVQVVFRHTEQLYDVHKGFQDQLRALERQGSAQFCSQLDRVFEEVAPKLQVYFQYFSHLPAAKARMEADFQATPELRSQLCQLQDVICAGNTFDELYDSPIRQSTNYMLLFQRLAKTAAKEASPEAKASVDRAVVRLRALLDAANTYKRQADQSAATVEVLAKVAGLPPELKNPAEIGLLLADGPFRVRLHFSATAAAAATAGGKERKESRDLSHCVLTTKQLLVAAKSAKKEPLTYWFAVPTSCSLQSRRLDASSLELTLDGDSSTTVKLEEPSKRGYGSDKWIRLLREAKAACYPAGWNNNGHAFELVTFPAGTGCSACGQLFNGVVLQAHECSHCHLRLDAACLRARAQPQCRSLRPSAEYFHAGLDRKRAVTLLQRRQPGTFLLRPKAGSSSQWVLSVKVASQADPIHIEILADGAGRLSLGSNQRRQFGSLDELLEYYSQVNMSAHFSQVNCVLTGGVVAGAQLVAGLLRENSL